MNAVGRQELLVSSLRESVERGRVAIDHSKGEIGFYRRELFLAEERQGQIKKQLRQAIKELKKIKAK